jgi:hypothetical protein
LKPSAMRLDSRLDIMDGILISAQDSPHAQHHNSAITIALRTVEQIHEGGQVAGPMNRSASGSRFLELPSLLQDSVQF